MGGKNLMFESFGFQGIIIAMLYRQIHYIDKLSKELPGNYPDIALETFCDFFDEISRC